MTTIQPTIRPTAKQELAWDALSFDKPEIRFVGLGGGAGGGKTWMGCEWLLTNCYFYPGSRWFIARNELKRLMNSTYVTWRKVTKHHGIPEDDWVLDGKYNVIRFKNGSTIDLLDVAYKPTDPDYERFGSLEYTGGFGEEAGEWHFGAFDVLKSRTGRHNTFDGKELPPKFYLTFNPTKGWVYRIFYKPWKNGLLPEDYVYIQSLYSDNPYTSKSYGEQLSSISNAAMRARLKEGDWEYDDDVSALTSLDALSDLFTNTITKDGNRYLIVDVARKGADRTVFSFWEGLELSEVQVFTKQTTDITEQKIRDYAAAKRIPFSQILIDEDGIGGGVVDHLPGVKGFTANSTAFLSDREIATRGNHTDVYRQNFANLKAQCGWKAAELINTHKMAVRVEGYRDDIIEELSTTLREKDPDTEGRLRLVPKDEVKSTLGKSPDIGDTIIMRAYFELMPGVSLNQDVSMPQRALFMQNEAENAQFGAA